MRTIVAGSRTITDYELIKKTLNQNKLMISVVLSGRAQGPDLLGERWATEEEVPLELYPAQWKIQGKAAGFLRNIEMAKKADWLIAFWDGSSRGTNHMILTADQFGLLTTVIRVPR